MEANPLYIPEIIAAIIIALSAIALGIQSLVLKFKSGKAESSVMALLHDELTRLAKQNRSLSEEIGKLQNQVIGLSAQLRTLSDENTSLNEKISQLNCEISKLESVVSSKGIQ